MSRASRSPVATVLAVLALAAVLAPLVTIARSSSRRPNVVLITVDTLRPDHLSCYGYGAIATPAIDRLASEGALFENAFADVTWTTASMASVMTGLYAPHHGIRTSYQRLSPERKTLAEYLGSQGFETAAIIGSFPLDAIFGLNQGFRTYDDRFTAPLSIDPEHPPAPGSAIEHVPSRFSADQKAMNAFLTRKVEHDAYRPDDQVTDAAIDWLAAHRREPFFLWVHYFGPHEKPQPTPDYMEERRRQLAAYDPDIVVADREVGRLLDALRAAGIDDHTAVILHADHGQSLTEHGYFGHGRFIFDATQHVPLIVRPPRPLSRPLRVDHMVRNVDIMPTVLELVGAKADAGIDGASLVGALRGEALQTPEETYVETYLSSNRLFADVIDVAKDTRLGFRRVGFRTRQWKLVMNDPVPFGDVADPEPIDPDTRRHYYHEELYDLATDPAEEHDVIRDHPDVAIALRRRVWLAQPKPTDVKAAVPIAPTTRERLKSLGYVD
ncbi:MAG TPA: sulfatase [Candidatus Binatia bacterium]|jgi:arylsulfatase A-like enzyme